MQEHYIGIDVGTGSARACLIDSTGEIKALAAENIKLWQPATGYGGTHYVRLRSLSSWPLFGQNDLSLVSPLGAIHHGHLEMHLYMREEDCGRVQG